MVLTVEVMMVKAIGNRNTMYTEYCTHLYEMKLSRQNPTPRGCWGVGIKGPWGQELPPEAPEPPPVPASSMAIPLKFGLKFG